MASFGGSLHVIIYANGMKAYADTIQDPILNIYDQRWNKFKTEDS